MGFLAMSTPPGLTDPSIPHIPFANGAAGSKHYAESRWNTPQAHTSSTECQARRVNPTYCWAPPTSWKVLAAHAKDTHLSISQELIAKRRVCRLTLPFRETKGPAEERPELGYPRPRLREAGPAPVQTEAEVRGRPPGGPAPVPTLSDLGGREGRGSPRGLPAPRSRNDKWLPLGTLQAFLPEHPSPRASDLHTDGWEPPPSASSSPPHPFPFLPGSTPAQIRPGCQTHGRLKSCPKPLTACPTGTAGQRPVCPPKAPVKILGAAPEGLGGSSGGKWHWALSPDVLTREGLAHCLPRCREPSPNWQQPHRPRFPSPPSAQSKAHMYSRDIGEEGGWW